MEYKYLTFFILINVPLLVFYFNNSKIRQAIFDQSVEKNVAFISNLKITYLLNNYIPWLLYYRMKTVKLKFHLFIQ